jgi:hypothetical protein
MAASCPSPSSSSPPSASGPPSLSYTTTCEHEWWRLSCGAPPSRAISTAHGRACAPSPAPPIVLLLRASRRPLPPRPFPGSCGISKGSNRGVVPSLPRPPGGFGATWTALHAHCDDNDTSVTAAQAIQAAFLRKLPALANAPRRLTGLCAGRVETRPVSVSASSPPCSGSTRPRGPYPHRPAATRYFLDGDAREAPSIYPDWSCSPSLVEEEALALIGPAGGLVLTPGWPGT